MRSVRRGVTAAVAALVATALWVPAASAELAVAVDDEDPPRHSLVFFDTAKPEDHVVRRITGLPSGYLAGMDVRPATGDLLLLWTEDGAGANDTVGTLWRVDLATGVATQVGAAPFSTTLNDTQTYGFDVNPVADRIRVVTSEDSNFRLDPNNGSLLATDAPLVALGAFDVWGAAYDRSLPGATATTLFDIDVTGDRLMRQGGVDNLPSANGGALTAIGPLGVDVAAGSAPGVAFEISGTTGTAYLVDSQGLFSANSYLYTVNLTTGAATLVGRLPFSAYSGIAILNPSTIEAAMPAVGAAEGAGSVAVTVTRTGTANTAATIDFATADGTAVAGSDYVAVSGTLNFAPGVASRTIQVPLVADASVEPDETFAVNLSGVAGATAGGATSTVATITNDDVAAPVDTAKPVVLLTAIATRALGAVTKSGVASAFSCSEACTAQATIRYGTRVVGSGSPVKLAAAGLGTSRAKLSKSGVATVKAVLAPRKVRSAKLVYLLTVKDAAGNTTVKQTPVVVTG